MKKKTIIVSATSDLVTDQRVHKVCNTLQNNGYTVILIGRRKKDSLAMPDRGYTTVRFKLFFEKGAMFYASYNLSLFWFLLTHRADILLSNDLDTLLPNYITAKLFKRKLIYDSHEYYTGVPELMERPFVRGIWEKIEGYILPKLKSFYTVNESIAALYRKQYQCSVQVVRNIPLYTEVAPAKELPITIPTGKKVVLYQGAGINIDRGLEETIEAFQYIDIAILLVIGGGDVIEDLKNQVKTKGLDSKVFFIAKLPFEQLKAYTQLAQLGLTLDKNTNINYRFSLPNKIFDYIHAGLPILASRLVEIERIVENKKVGDFIENHSPNHIAERITFMLSDENQWQQWHRNCLSAAKELNWQNEEKIVLRIINEA